jgi:electron transport complex protein RnfC
VAQFDLSAPVIKATNAILAFSGKEDKSVKNPTCIRCGKCSEVCPMCLVPMYMYMYERKSDLVSLERLHVTDCIECGACTYVCPGRLHLTQSFRTAKEKLRAEKAKKQAAAEKAEKEVQKV